MRKIFLIAALLTTGLYAIGQSETPPEALNLYATMDKIGYPDDAKSAGVEGTVLAQVTINEKGRVVDYEIKKSPSPILSGAVEKHVESLKFKPAKKDGEAIKSIVQVPFRFELPAAPDGKVCTSVADALKDPSAVTELDLSGRKSSELSPELAKCINIRVLTLDGMDLGKVPSWIRALKNLQELSLADNSLSSLPGWLVKMPLLESLDIQENKISKKDLLDIREKYENIDLLTD